VTITLGDLALAVESISPLRLAASWDNVGLIIGDRASPIARALLTIDLTDAVLDEAASLTPRTVRRDTRGAGRSARTTLDSGAADTVVLAYHPPIFEPLKQFTADDSRGALLLRAARELAGVISPHTALDAVANGMSDWLAEGVGAGMLAPIEPANSLPHGESVMVATKLPRDAVERVRDAMSLVGAGRLGDYTRCSFELAGHGTFEGAATTTPRVGQRQRLERVEESKLEMVSSKSALPAVLAALRSAHPYEEPPIEVLSLAARPSVRDGQGRVLLLVKPNSTAQIAKRLARHLGTPLRTLEIVDAAPSTPRSAQRLKSRAASSRRTITHERIGLCPGSGGALVARAIELGCTLFVTGEMKHHERLDAAARGCTVILAGHTETERGFLPRYRDRLRRALPRFPITLAQSDRPPARRGV